MARCSRQKRREAIIPVPDVLIAEVKAYRVKMATYALRNGTTIGELMFPSQDDAAIPIDRHEFRTWLEIAERKANLPKLDGGLWHAYRRAWATSRKHLPVADVAAVGGWKDYGTLLKCYTQADNETMLAVMNEPRKLTEKAVSG